MSKVNVELPYEVGTYLTEEENGIIHIHQIDKYIFDAFGISAILMLDVFDNPRLSTSIEIDKLINNYEEYNPKQEENVKNTLMANFIYNVLIDLFEINDSFVTRGSMPDIYIKIFEKYGCKVERYDFEFEETIITRVSLTNNPKSSIEIEEELNKLTEENKKLVLKKKNI